jgi:beta-lactam-binding protein with PASTA domain
MSKKNRTLGTAFFCLALLASGRALASGPSLEEVRSEMDRAELELEIFERQAARLSQQIGLRGEYERRMGAEMAELERPLRQVRHIKELFSNGADLPEWAKTGETLGTAWKEDPTRHLAPVVEASQDLVSAKRRLIGSYLEADRAVSQLCRISLQPFSSTEEVRLAEVEIESSMRRAQADLVEVTRLAARLAEWPRPATHHDAIKEFVLLGSFQTDIRLSWHNAVSLYDKAWQITGEAQKPRSEAVESYRRFYRTLFAVQPAIDDLRDGRQTSEEATRLERRYQDLFAKAYEQARALGMTDQGALELSPPAELGSFLSLPSTDPSRAYPSRHEIEVMVAIALSVQTDQPEPLLELSGGVSRAVDLANEAAAKRAPTREELMGLREREERCRREVKLPHEVFPETPDSPSPSVPDPAGAATTPDPSAPAGTSSSRSVETTGRQHADLPTPSPSDDPTDPSTQPVAASTPPPGPRVLSDGTIPLPDVVGWLIDDAVLAVRAAGLEPVPRNGGLALSADKLGRVRAAIPGVDGALHSGDPVILEVSTELATAGKIPPVVGLYVDEAYAAVEAEGFSPLIVVGEDTSNLFEVNRISKQFPPAGTPAQAGSQVQLVAWVAEVPGRVVPNLVRFTVGEARGLVSQRDLFLEVEAIAATSPSQSAGTVGRQYPEPGIEVPQGTAIRAFVYDEYKPRAAGGATVPPATNAAGSGNSTSGSSRGGRPGGSPSSVPVVEAAAVLGGKRLTRASVCRQEVGTGDRVRRPANGFKCGANQPRAVDFFYYPHNVRVIWLEPHDRAPTSLEPLLPFCKDGGRLKHGRASPDDPGGMMAFSMLSSARSKVQVNVESYGSFEEVRRWSLEAESLLRSLIAQVEPYAQACQ